MNGWSSTEWLLLTRTRLCQKYLSPLSWDLMCICSAVAAERDANGNICIRGTEINFHWRNWEGSERREEHLIDRSDREQLLISWISLGWGAWAKVEGKTKKRKWLLRWGVFRSRLVLPPAPSLDYHGHWICFLLNRTLYSSTPHNMIIVPTIIQLNFSSISSSHCSDFSEKYFRKFPNSRGSLLQRCVSVTWCCGRQLSSEQWGVWVVLANVLCDQV